MSIIDRLRQPEYTGENRCTPCTAVNVAIVAVAGTLVAKAKSRALGTAAFGVSLGTIYLRGYLVPGTPQLTKRYLPDRVLRWFEKEPAPAPVHEHDDLDPERVLLDAGTVTPCENDTDLCLTDEFRSEWHDQVRAVRKQNDPDESACVTFSAHRKRGSPWRSTATHFWLVPTMARSANGTPRPPLPRTSRPQTRSRTATPTGQI
jgi:hypothetical protein